MGTNGMQAEAGSQGNGKGASLEVRGLCAARAGALVIDGLNFSLPAGASLALVGESGCGKSTLLEALAGLLKPVSGEVRWHSASGAAPKAAFVWQNLGLFPWKRVAENLALPLELEGRSKQEVRAKVSAMLEELGLQGLERPRFRAASGSGLRSDARSLQTLKSFFSTSPFQRSMRCGASGFRNS